MPLVSLVAFSIACGVLILLVFKLASNQRALEAARRQMRAHLLAIRLFGDDPVVILRSQGRLIVWTARYVALLLPAFLMIAVPFYFAWDSLEALWGRSPLVAGETTILTARVRDDATDVRLAVPGWLAVDSPAVHVTAEHEVSWRLRVRQAGDGDVSLTAGPQHVETRVVARSGLHYLAGRQRASAPGPIEWVEVRYPPGVNWVLWFFVISTVTAVGLRRALRVTF